MMKVLSVLLLLLTVMTVTATTYIKLKCKKNEDIVQMYMNGCTDNDPYPVGFVSGKCVGGDATGDGTSFKFSHSGTTITQSMYSDNADCAGTTSDYSYTSGVCGPIGATVNTTKYSLVTGVNAIEIHTDGTKDDCSDVKANDAMRILNNACMPNTDEGTSVKFACSADGTTMTSTDYSDTTCGTKKGEPTEAPSGSCFDEDGNVVGSAAGLKPTVGILFLVVGTLLSLQ